MNLNNSVEFFAFHRFQNRTFKDYHQELPRTKYEKEGNIYLIVTVFIEIAIDDCMLTG